MKKTLILLFVLLIAVLPAAAQDNVNITGGDEETLRSFIMRFAGQRSLYEPQIETTIVIGELPDTMTDISNIVPEDAEVIGGLTYNGGYDDGAATIYFDVPMSIEELTAFYEEETPEGFYIPVAASMARPGGGFVGTQATENIGLCTNDGEMLLNFMLRERAETESTQVMLGLNSIEQMGAPICNEDFNPNMFGGGGLFEKIPELVTPEGASARQEGGGGGGNYAETGALITTEEFDATALLADYEEQLIEQGWELVASTAGETGGFSTWLVEDEDGDIFSGTLSVIAIAGTEDEYTARLALRKS